MTTLADVKRRMRDPVPDPVQCRLDRDWAVGQLTEALENLAAMTRALRDIELLGQEATDAAFAAVSLARMVRTDPTVLTASLREET